MRVPGSLLLDRRLAGSARLVWMILQMGLLDGEVPASWGQISAVAGLARKTVREGLVQLKSAGWLPGPERRADPVGWARMPVELLTDTRLSIQSKMLYGCLQLTTEFRGRTGRFSYPSLSTFMGASPNTIKHAVRNLQETGWLQCTQANRLQSIQFRLQNPLTDRAEAEAAAAASRLRNAPFLGEALMREYLSLLVDSDEYEDNATPGFLVNPFTGEEMQYDRYYPPSVAFEFNGRQHYGPTEWYPSETRARNQQGRDYIKMGISQARGIRLVIVHPADLTLEGMLEKVDGLLPLRQLRNHQPLVRHLAAVSRQYRRKAAQGALAQGVRQEGGS